MIHDASPENPVADAPVGRHRAVADREKEEQGAIKVGPASFGWLTASGVAILLTALAAAGGVAPGGVIALIAVLVVILVAALLGGLASMMFHRTVDKTGLGT